VCHADELYYFWKPYWKKAAIQVLVRFHLTNMEAAERQFSYHL